MLMIKTRKYIFKMIGSRFRVHGSGLTTFEPMNFERWTDQPPIYYFCMKYKATYIGRNDWVSSNRIIRAGKRQSRLQLSQLEVFSRCLNAKSEYRNPKQYQNSNIKWPKLYHAPAWLRNIYQSLRKYHLFWI